MLRPPYLLIKTLRNLKEFWKDHLVRFSLLIAEYLSRNVSISSAENRFHSPRGPLCRHMDVMVIRFGAMRHGISSQRKSSRTAE